jgi:hypothetical protein
MRRANHALHRFRRAGVLAAALLVTLVVATRPAEAASASIRPAAIYQSGAHGYDVSWPNCAASAPSRPPFGIVGATGGTGYSQNPCLAKEAAWFPNLSLYINTGWYNQSSHLNPNSPKACAVGDNNCLAYNYGYNGGLNALAYANSLGVHAATWWLDVETGNTWNADTTQNRNSLQGAHDALVASGVTTVGVYSTTYQWDTITGTWLNGWPGWGATTVRTARQAAQFCKGHQFTGGPTYLIQFSGTLDQDYAC